MTALLCASEPPRPRYGDQHLESLRVGQHAGCLIVLGECVVGLRDPFAEYLQARADPRLLEFVGQKASEIMDFLRELERPVLPPAKGGVQ